MKFLTALWASLDGKKTNTAIATLALAALLKYSGLITDEAATMLAAAAVPVLLTGLGHKGVKAARKRKKGGADDV